jgi:hypothetical protein
MDHDFEHGAPFYFATRNPPSATALDDDIYLTVTTIAPPYPDEPTMIDIILSVEYAKHAIAQLYTAVEAATKHEAR